MPFDISKLEIKKSEIYDQHYCDDISNYEDLQFELEDIKEEIQCCLYKLESANNYEKIKLTNIIRELEAKKVSGEKRLENLYANYCKSIEKRDSIIKEYYELAKEAVKENVKTISLKNSIHIRLKNNTNTSVLLQEFFDNQQTEEFLILDSAFYYSYQYTISLIITHVNYLMPHYSRKEFTLTELKMNYGKNIKSHEYPERMVYLIENIQKIVTGNKIKYRKTIVFDKPILLCGQTELDRFGYGIDHLYGEGRSMFAIGIIVDPD